jgi:pimeloyl-ACP methyl ester carboxylesterase
MSLAVLATTLGMLAAAEARDSGPRQEPCRVPGIEEALRCVNLLVPENWTRPGGRMIGLHVVVVPALHPDPSRPPLFDLAGGPGIAGSGAASFYATEGRIHREQRDVVLVDQRGTGESSPLHCEALERRPALLRMYPPQEVRRCRQALAARADLAQYTTAAAAADLEAVRAALGYPAIDLFGLSYGTRLARAYLRRHPERVHAVALVGTVGDDKKLPLWHARGAQEVLDRVFAQCAGDPSCAGSFPHLSDEWPVLLRRLDAHPVGVAVGPEGGERRIDMARGPFAEALRTLLVTPTGQRRVPLLVHQMFGGRFESFVKAVRRGQGLEGLYLSVVCAEDTPWITASERQEATGRTFLGTYRIDEQAGACREWRVPKVREPEVAPTGSDVPALFLAGGMDYVTPKAWAEEVAEQFPRGRIVDIPDLGHFPDGLSHMECLDALLADFYARGEAQAVDASCVATMKPPPFVLSEESR